MSWWSRCASSRRKTGWTLVAAELLDVGADGVEDGGGGAAGDEAEGEAELAVEVAPAERGVVAVGETEAVLGQAMAQGAQHAGLADAGLADEQHVAASRQASTSASTTPRLDAGSHRSASAISLVKGDCVRPKCAEPARHRVTSIARRRSADERDRAARRGVEGDIEAALRRAWRRGGRAACGGRCASGRRGAARSACPRARPTGRVVGSSSERRDGDDAAGEEAGRVSQVTPPISSVLSRRTRRRAVHGERCAQRCLVDASRSCEAAVS